ncbi:hypothetical protein [Sphingobium sp.]|nr:hypothetical protein [Sphingobium sp.]HUD94408.1 hypothetical protein [Sphingobium sp.]
MSVFDIRLADPAIVADVTQSLVERLGRPAAVDLALQPREDANAADTPR